MACQFCGDESCEFEECVFPSGGAAAAARKNRLRNMDGLDDILTDKWEPGSFDATTAMMDRPEAVARTQEMQRQDPMFAGNMRSERAQQVGTRVRLAYRPNHEMLGQPVEWQDEISLHVEDLWEHDMEDSYNCWGDAAGMSTFSGLLGLGGMELMASGEVLGTLEEMSDVENRRPFESAFNIIDTARLVTPLEFKNSGNVKQGIRVDKRGRPVRWYIHDEHPHGMYRFSSMLRESKRRGGGKKKRYKSVEKQYSWGKPKLIHYFDRERAGQNRAKPHISPALRKIKGLQQYDDVTLQAAFRDAVHAIWLESNDPNVGQAFSSPQAAQMKPQELFSAMHLAAQKIRNIGNERKAKLGGRDIVQLTAGETLNASRGGFSRQGQQEFVKSFMWHIARAVESDTASYTGDFTDQTYSSIRAALIQTLASRAYKQDMLFRSLGYPIFMSWFEEKVARGDIVMPISSNRRMRHLDYFYKNRRALTNIDLYGPGMDHIDQIKGQKAWESRIACGMGTRTEYFRRHTTTTMREFVADAKREERMLKDAGLGHMIKNNEALPGTQNDRVAQDRDE